MAESRAGRTLHRWLMVGPQRRRCRGKYERYTSTVIAARSAATKRRGTSAPEVGRAGRRYGATLVVRSSAAAWLWETPEPPVRFSQPAHRNCTPCAQGDGVC